MRQHWSYCILILSCRIYWYEFCMSAIVYNFPVLIFSIQLTPTPSHWNVTDCHLWFIAWGKVCKLSYIRHEDTYHLNSWCSNNLGWVYVSTENPIEKHTDLFGSRWGTVVYAALFSLERELGTEIQLYIRCMISAVTVKYPAHWGQFL